MNESALEKIYEAWERSNAAPIQKALQMDGSFNRTFITWNSSMGNIYYLENPGEMMNDTLKFLICSQNVAAARSYPWGLGANNIPIGTPAQNIPPPQGYSVGQQMPPHIHANPNYNQPTPGYPQQPPATLDDGIFRLLDGRYHLQYDGILHIGSKDEIEAFCIVLGCRKLFDEYFKTPLKPKGCEHDWREYVGFTSRDYYCSKCNDRKEWT